MKRTLFLIVLSLISLSQNSYSQTLSEEEQTLYDLIMDYRVQHGLSEIALSPSLTYVAQAHVKDLNENKPNQSPCDIYSWSDTGDWIPCCYTSGEQADCMWHKPQELTKYSGYGFELIVRYRNITAYDAFTYWQGSQHLDAVLINQGQWENYWWRAIGIAIDGDYTSVWFGRMEDTHDEDDFLLPEDPSEVFYNRAREYFYTYKNEYGYLEATKWFLEASEYGHAEAMVFLGEIYARGLGTDVDMDQSVAWLEKAGEHGMHEAFYLIGEMYYDGEGREQDKEKALEYFIKAADNGYEVAMRYIGTMYLLGEGGLEKNREEAIVWLKKAANLDDAEAKTILESLPGN